MGSQCSSPLHRAVQEDSYINVVELILEGASIESINWLGQTPIDILIQKQNADMLHVVLNEVRPPIEQLEKYLQKAITYPESYDSIIKCLLLEYCEQGHMDLAIEILEKGYFFHNNHEMTAAVNALLERGDYSSIKHFFVDQSVKISILKTLTMFYSLDALRVCLDDEQNQAVLAELLICGIYNINYDAVEFLIQKGADVFFRLRGFSPYSKALGIFNHKMMHIILRCPFSNHWKIVFDLVKYGYYPHAIHILKPLQGTKPVDMDGETILTFFVQLGKDYVGFATEILEIWPELLTENNKYKMAPIFLAAKYHKKHLFRLFLKMGASVDESTLQDEYVDIVKIYKLEQKLLLLEEDFVEISMMPPAVHGGSAYRQSQSSFLRKS